MEEQKDWMGWKHPDDMTPEERLDEILDIIARGAVRLALEEKLLGHPMLSPLPTGRGRMPFGVIKEEGRRFVNLVEAALIERIDRLRAEGLSLAKIAKRLNDEDRESRRAGKWSGAAVWRILRRKKQKGARE